MKWSAPCGSMGAWREGLTMSLSFEQARLPKIVFGAGTIAKLPELIRGYGDRALALTGGRSLDEGGRWAVLEASLSEAGIRVLRERVEVEPSPELIDGLVDECGGFGARVVVGIGGGSVMDAGKAVSAMLPLERSVVDFLEGVGTGESHPGVKVPYIAAPTTAGTGGEATKNAVLSRVAESGFKKSLRHDDLVPDIALVDPGLMTGCPREVTAACGMDALTQLLESYVSTGATPETDALAMSGMVLAARSLVAACGDGAGDLAVRGAMAYAGLASGITLANAGLGVVHGLAGPIGGRFPVPHGVACGTLLAPATRATIEKLAREHGWDHPALEKYAAVGRMMGGEAGIETVEACALLVDRLDELTVELELPLLSAYGIAVADLPGFVTKGVNKFNPVELTPAEIEGILRRRL